ncbi:MAG: hypothetical protein EXS41_09805 [Opitutaceae bacterium]|nr:hypothetical protein [Opitutaceae bacterium]
MGFLAALLAARWIKNQRIPHSVDFHEQLVCVIMTRNPVQADRKMHEHLHFTADAIEATARQLKPIGMAE